MYVIATFEQSVFLELALTELEGKGIAQEEILAVPLEKRKTFRQITDTLHRADGHSVIDLAAVLGTVFMLLGTIYGYILRWGPILWGIIGAVSGMTAGFFMKLAMVRKKTKPNPGKITSEVVVLVSCGASQSEMVEQVLRENMALGVAKIDVSGSTKNG